MKDRRGGAGRGQGRREVLRWLDRIAVGAGFERLWERAQRIEAQKKYLANSENVRIEQEIDELQQAYRDAEVRLKYRESEREQRQKRTGDRLDESGRRLSLHLKRPKDQRARVTAVVVRWARLKYAKGNAKKAKRITARRVEACIIEYRNFVRYSRLLEQQFNSLAEAGYGPLE